MSLRMKKKNVFFRHDDTFNFNAKFVLRRKTVFRATAKKVKIQLKAWVTLIPSQCFNLQIAIMQWFKIVLLLSWFYNSSSFLSTLIFDNENSAIIRRLVRWYATMQSVNFGFTFVRFFFSFRFKVCQVLCVFYGRKYFFYLTTHPHEVIKHSDSLFSLFVSLYLKMFEKSNWKSNNRWNFIIFLLLIVVPFNCEDITSSVAAESMLGWKYQCWGGSSTQ